MSGALLGWLLRRQGEPPNNHEERRPGALSGGGVYRRKPLVADGGTRPETDDADHLRDLPDGAGCAEIWEHLSDRQGGEGCNSEGRSRASSADD